VAREQEARRVKGMIDRWKCNACYTIVDENPCPVCGEKSAIVKMCPNDCVCTCLADVKERLAYCPICGQGMCPTCGSHDVAQLTRITGYINDVAGFNNGKAQEVKDRVRSDVVSGSFKRVNGKDD
jgi:RNA polymerase subunit RPABC4/transcription elongation factor Spt4